MRLRCSEHDCDRPRHAKQLCNMHYQRLWKRGAASDEALSRKPTGELRAWIMAVMSYRGDNCIRWPSSLNRSGYGNITIDGKLHMPHRLVCIAMHGAPPSFEHEVAHACGNSACCNPLHLRWATKKENAADKRLHGTQKSGEAHHNAKLSNEAVAYIRDSRGETQSSLAKQFGVSFQTISDIRRGKHRLNDDVNFAQKEAV